VKILDEITSVKAEGPGVRNEIKIRLILYYLVGGSIAPATNLLMSPGLDFSAEQMKMVSMVFFPVSVVLCILVDIPLILYQIPAEDPVR